MKIKLAANYSQNLLTLIDKQQLELDYIKLSREDVIEEELALASQYRPILLHHLPHLGKPWEFWQNYDWLKLQTIVTQARCPYLSIHLDAYRSEVGDLNQADLLQLLLKNYRYLISQVNQNLIIENKKLIVENCDHSPHEKLSPEVDRLNHVFQIDFINQFLEKSGAGLLLDLAHAQCGAFYLQQDIHQYLGALRLDLVEEIHLAGAREIAGQLVDTHFCLQDLDYELLAWVLPQTKARVVTLEYGGTGKLYLTKEKNDLHSLKEQLLKITKITQQFSKENEDN